MKPRLLFATASVVALQATAPAQPPATAVLIETTTGDAAEVRAIGERAIARVGYSLVTEVTAAVAKTGPVDALAICHLKDLPATGTLVPGLPRVTAIKSTSLRVRSPANAPDLGEQLALDRINTALQAGDMPPKTLVQRVVYPNGAAEWRVYRPIAVAAQCLACHGPRDEMPVALRDELSRRFPSDEAFDYQPGEWRGLIRVTISDVPPAPTKR